MDRFVRMVEGTAGLLLLTVALATFATVVLRKLVNYSPPDWFDLAQLVHVGYGRDPRVGRSVDAGRHVYTR